MSDLDARDFAEGFIHDALRPILNVEVPIYRGSRPKREDPDFYVSILTEEENEVQPGAGTWIMSQAVGLVCSIAERDSENHTLYRARLRTALMELTAVQNFSVAEQGRWYGMFITSIAKSNRSGHYGDIFYLETRARAF